jgi:hypothetical protein
VVLRSEYKRGWGGVVSSEEHRAEAEEEAVKSEDRRREGVKLQKNRRKEARGGKTLHRGDAVEEAEVM